MEIEWEPPRTILPNTTSNNEQQSLQKRFELFLPQDADTGAVRTEAGYAYLHAMIEMVLRKNLPLSLICIAPDDSPTFTALDEEAARFIGQAIVRYIRQETRDYDLVYKMTLPTMGSTPLFALVCPLISEEEAALLAERLRKGMISQNSETEHAWLSLSAGVATLSLDAPDADSLMARAYAALSRARRMGGNRLWRHTDTLRALMEREPSPDDSKPAE